MFLDENLYLPEMVCRALKSKTLLSQGPMDILISITTTTKKRKPSETLKKHKPIHSSSYNKLKKMKSLYLRVVMVRS